jgi:hypothetical protein
MQLFSNQGQAAFVSGADSGIYPTVKARPFVVSGLAPRWSAQQPPSGPCVESDTPRWQIEGPLRSPTRGKPAHHMGLGGG